VIINSNIKLLKHKLENKEAKIKSLESNIDLLSQENKSLKDYIIQLETKYNNNKDNNDDINSNSNLILNEENKNINNNIDKVMYSINNFIKKMYSLFPNMEKEIKYEELKIEHYN
jgi:septal ring factor EnvC (AmiA/AmiB activator)